MNVDNNDIDILELIKIVWEDKIRVVIITSVFAIISVFIALYLPNQYKSVALLSPAEDIQGGGLSALASKYGSLASLAGISLPEASVDKKTTAIAILTSRNFLTDFINKHDISVPLFASVDWSARHDKLIIDEELYDETNNEWVREADELKQSAPTDNELYEVFSERFKVLEDTNTGLINISFEFYSPKVASLWLTLLINDLNDFVRKQDIDTAKSSIIYLTEQASLSDITNMEVIFYQLIEEQTKNMMLANTRNDYVFKIIDPPSIPDLDKESTPNRALICIGITFFGGIVAIVFVIARRFISI